MSTKNLKLISDKDKNPIRLTEVSMGETLITPDTEMFALYGNDISDCNTFQIHDLTDDANSYTSKPLFVFTGELRDENDELICRFINARPTGHFDILGREQAVILVNHVTFNENNELGREFSRKHQEHLINAKEKGETTFHYPEKDYFIDGPDNSVEDNGSPHVFFWDDEF